MTWFAMVADLDTLQKHPKEKNIHFNHRTAQIFLLQSFNGGVAMTASMVEMSL